MKVKTCHQFNLIYKAVAHVLIDETIVQDHKKTYLISKTKTKYFKSSKKFLKSSELNMPPLMMLNKESYKTTNKIKDKQLKEKEEE